VTVPTICLVTSLLLAAFSLMATATMHRRFLTVPCTIIFAGLAALSVAWMINVENAYNQRCINSGGIPVNMHCYPQVANNWAKP